jgi:NAD(P)-dependent dehydrogenase (short-subunit alcohol dehydrogenase family)
VARAAIVTGGGTGIGLAVARALAAEGYGVTVCGRRAAPVEAAAAEIGGLAVSANVASEADVERLLAEHRSRFGRLDVLVNNAGVEVHGPLEEMPVAEVDRQLEANLRGLILVSRAALEDLRAAGREHGKALLLNVSSLAGKEGLAGFAAYSASKAGVVGFGRSLQEELADHGVQVTAVCPAFVDTPMVAPWASVPPEQMMPPEDVASVLRFLLDTSPAARVPEIVLNRARLVPPVREA